MWTAILPAEIYLDQKSMDRRNYIRLLEIPVFMLAHGRRPSEIHREAFDPTRAAPPLPTVSVPPARAPAKGTEATGLRDGRHEFRPRTSAVPASTIG